MSLPVSTSPLSPTRMPLRHAHIPEHMLPVPVYFSAQSTPPPENSALSRLLLFLEKAWRQLHPKPSSPPQETPQQREDPPEPDTLERKALSLPESMAHGFDPNALEEGTELPRLLWTAKNGTYEAFEALLATGANPYATSKEGATLTHHAVYNEDPRVLAKVLKLGLNPAQESSFGVYPLMTACYEDNLNAIHQLLQAYLQHNIPLNPLLSEAICLLRPDILKEILQLGADPNSLNKEGERPLTVVFSLKTHNYILTTFSRQVEMSRILLAAGADPTIISFELQMILPLEDKDPKKLLSTFLAHRPHVNAATMEKFYATADNTGSSYEWKPLLPELLTIADHLAPDVLKNEWVINNISSAVTRPYRYIYSNDTSHPEQGHIQKLERIVLENWMRVGTMGLSFSRWRFDAMQPWKGIGPMAQNSLLESSGLFTPSPPRGDDATYHRSFQYTDPATGLCIELRRAYITLSQPELGTLVVRNSSHHYGRDLLPELAYYSPEQVYTGGEDLVNPKDLLEKNGFHGLLDKALHLTPELQSETHQKVGALRTGFEDVMSRYTDWKCGFKDGTPPPGFGPLLSLALKSAEHQGQNTPFGKQKNLRLAWVHPSELPVIRYALEMSNPDIQAEVRAYLTQPQNHAQYPQLLAFLESGLKQGWELILAPPTEA